MNGALHKTEPHSIGISAVSLRYPCGIPAVSLRYLLLMLCRCLSELVDKNRTAWKAVAVSHCIAALLHCPVAVASACQTRLEESHSRVIYGDISDATALL
jgi:hypothetical protein